MSGKTQEEAVTILRTTKLGSIVNLLISRQSTDQPPPKPARDNVRILFFITINSVVVGKV